MRGSWNKGLTKETHPSVRKISETMKRNKTDNFAVWREQMRQLGKIKSEYPDLEKNGDLAELIGVVLGDGHIGKFPRSEVLLLFSNSNNPAFVARYAQLIEKFFGKKPYVVKRKGSNCIKISLYQKNISERLGVPVGARLHKKISVPGWIFQEREYILRYLRGLYEAEGSYCVHKPTYTYKFLFSNRNESMLRNVYRLLKKLGFHPHMSAYQVQVSRKEEVEEVKNLIQFRQYIH